MFSALAQQVRSKEVPMDIDIPHMEAETKGHEKEMDELEPEPESKSDPEDSAIVVKLEAGIGNEEKEFVQLDDPLRPSGVASFT